MKDILKLAGAAALSLAARAAFAQNDIPITVDGHEVHFEGQGAVMSQDRVLVPLRGVLERMGAKVSWDATTQTVRADNSKTHVKLQIGDRMATVNGQSVKMDVPASTIDGTTMVPLRFVSESLGENVKWDEQMQRVEIMSDGYAVSSEKASHSDRVSDGHTQGMLIPDSLDANTIIEAVLSKPIDSASSQIGDKVIADVRTRSVGLPEGTKIEGVVDEVRHAAGARPGRLSLRFTKLILPTGKEYAVSGTFVGVGKVGADWTHHARFPAGTTFGVQLTKSIRFGR